MAQVKKGDRVSIHFTGKLEDGTIFDTTLDDGNHTGDGCGCDDCGCETGPMELVVGEGEFFLQVEEALVGMATGEKKTVIVPAEDAFGEYDEEKTFTVRRDQLPEGMNPEVGQELELTDDNDDCFPVTVIDADEESITLDANHPLAGDELTIEFELVEVL